MRERFNPCDKRLVSWLSPRGEFVPVAAGHEETALKIIARAYHKTDVEPADSYYFLFNRGWVRVVTSSDGQLYGENYRSLPNDTQIKKLKAVCLDNDIEKLIFTKASRDHILWSKNDTLSEGTIALHNTDKKLIYNYFTELRRDFEQALGNYAGGGISEKNFMLKSDVPGKLQVLSTNLLAKYPLPVQVVYTSAHSTTPKMNRGGYRSQSNTIYIYTDPVCSTASRFTRDGKVVEICTALDFKSMLATFMHEFIHYVQDQNRREKSGPYKLPPDWSTPGNYFKRGWEQQAHGIAHRERIQQLLKTKKPGELLTYLRAHGLAGTVNLQRLKTTDYAAWKAIMKQAALNIMADLPER
jgi:hypothetical protein